MEKKIFLSFVGFLTMSGFLFGNTWEIIKEKTWISEKDFPTDQIVFYETVNGLKKAIWQLNGSGRCAVLSVVYDVDLSNDTIYLRDGLVLDSYVGKNTRKNGLQEQLILLLKNDTVLISESIDYDYKKAFDDARICNWLERYSGYTIVPIEKLKEIPIQEKMIYDKHSFNFGPDPSNCGIDNNPELTELEADFLNEYLKSQARQKNFDFRSKKIVFATGSGGSLLGNKNDYFENVKKWKETYNDKIATSLIILDEKDKEEYGYDAIVTYWVKVIRSKANRKILEQTKEKK